MQIYNVNPSQPYPTEDWITVKNPLGRKNEKYKDSTRLGRFGWRRKLIEKQFDEKYNGRENWRLAWLAENKVYTLSEALVELYEESYYKYLKDNPNPDNHPNHGLLDFLIKNAKDVYDNNLSNIKSGTDYSKQESSSNHYQDIALRRVLQRLELSFQGTEYIQVRSDSKSRGKYLSPFFVPFHKPDLIIKPIRKSSKFKVQSDTVEDFWQSNKILQIRKAVATALNIDTST